MRVEIIQVLKESMISSTRFLYQWLTTDGEILGFILAVLHVLVSCSLLFCNVLAHTIYPIWQFKLGVYICMSLVWLQHLFLNVCIFTVAELSLTKLTPPSNLYFAYVYKKLLGENIFEAMTNLIAMETIGIGCFTLEMISILSAHIYSLYDIQL